MKLKTRKWGLGCEKPAVGASSYTMMNDDNNNNSNTMHPFPPPCLPPQHARSHRYRDHDHALLLFLPPQRNRRRGRIRNDVAKGLESVWGTGEGLCGARGGECSNGSSDQCDWSFLGMLFGHNVIGGYMENGINVDPVVLTIEEFGVAGDMNGKVSYLSSERSERATDWGTEWRCDWATDWLRSFSDDGRSINYNDWMRNFSDDGRSMDGPTQPNLPSSLSTDWGTEWRCDWATDWLRSFSDDGRSINYNDWMRNFSDDGRSMDGPTQPNLPSSLSTDWGTEWRWKEYSRSSTQSTIIWGTEWRWKEYSWSSIQSTIVAFDRQNGGSIDNQYQ